MKAYSKVRFTKIEALNLGNDGAPIVNFDILPVNYENEGVLLNDIEVGSSILMLRSKRNDVETPGIFQTSPVKKIEGDLIYTENSVWKVEGA